MLEGIQRYVAHKRADGLAYATARATFLVFCKAVGDIPLSQVTTHDLMMYLDGSAVASTTWHARYMLLNRFFKYWTAKGAMPYLSMPPKRLRIRSSYVPHIYTQSQIHTLLASANENQSVHGCQIDASTLRMIVLLLYATGATLGELLGVKRQDVNMRKRTIRVKNQYIAGFRDIPMGDDLRRLVLEYKVQRFAKSRVNGYFFLRRSGEVLTRQLVSHNFSRLRRIGGIGRNDGVLLSPRLQDLRPTFAVQRIASWIADGVDLNIMLPALAAYMGQVGLGSTERYLSFTPSRFRKQLNSLSPKQGRHWRDDSVLMGFLESLQMMKIGPA